MSKKFSDQVKKIEKEMGYNGCKNLDMFNASIVGVDIGQMKGEPMRLIDADALLTDRMKSKYYHLPNGDIAIPIIDIEHAPTAEPNWIPLHFDEYKMASDYPYEMDGKWVIVTDGENISVERIKKDAYDHFYPNGRWFEMENVIAWMPLPKPYEMERSDDEHTDKGH